MSVKEKIKIAIDRLMRDKTEEKNQSMVENEIDSLREEGEIVLEKIEKKPKSKLFSKFFNWKKKTNDSKDEDEQISYTLGRSQTKKIFKDLINKNITHLYFYTSSVNVFRILEQGIKPTKMIKLAKGEEYIVWTYLEKPNHIELELSNSTRYYFWQWCIDQMIDPNSIAIIYINLKKLFNVTSSEWDFNEQKQHLIIKEPINIKAIESILIKDRRILKRIEQYLKYNNSNIKVFYGESGNIRQK